MRISMEEALGRFERSLEALFDSDIYLLEHDINERTITHKLAEHLQVRFPEWHVDCEYNRDGHDPKRIRIETGLASIQINVYPDIIIHERGTNERNLLIVEAKKSNDPRLNGAEADHQRIEGFSASLGYQIGVFLEFNVGEGQTEGWLLAKEAYFEDSWHDLLA